MNFDSFEKDMSALGFQEVVERKWAPYASAAEHSHPFSVRAVVVEGELWLRIGTLTRHLRSGDAFSLAIGELHEERYGATGATYWAARRTP